MTAFPSLTAKSIFAVALLFGSALARAEYDPAKLRQVAGGYLDAIEFATQLKESKCGYLFQAETDSFPQALADMAGYLSDDDLSALRAFVASAEFRDVQRQHRWFIEDWLASSAQYQDEPSVCRTTGSSVQAVYENAKRHWTLAKEYYGK